VNNYANLLQVSNSISIWLGISPPDLFFYAVSLLKRCSGMQGLLAACRHIAGHGGMASGMQRVCGGTDSSAMQALPSLRI
jgi:hypothetical protein